MGTPEDDQSLALLRTLDIGDVLTGTVAEVTRSGTTVRLDDLSGEPIGIIGPLDLSWKSFKESAEIVEIGTRVRAEVISVDLRERRVWLSRAATENPQLWAFLKALRPGERLSGTVAAIERFGVFVDLDDGPPHPTFPGVGFITLPELSWQWFEDTSEVISLGQHITCAVLAFDTHNGEARLSLRATQPDPFQQFAHRVHVGQPLQATVTKLVPFGAFVRVEDGVDGLVHISELSTEPSDALQAGDEITVIITNIDPQRRRLALSHRQAP